MSYDNKRIFVSSSAATLITFTHLESLQSSLPLSLCAWCLPLVLVGVHNKRPIGGHRKGKQFRRVYYLHWRTTRVEVEALEDEQQMDSHQLLEGEERLRPTTTTMAGTMEEEEEDNNSLRW